MVTLEEIGSSAQVCSPMACNMRIVLYLLEFYHCYSDQISESQLEEAKRSICIQMLARCCELHMGVEPKYDSS